MSQFKTLEDKQQAEILFWRDTPQVAPESNSILNIANKMADAGIFIQCLNANNKLLKKQGTVLELGSGQGWAACIYKRIFPQTTVMATDISQYAIASVSKWEKMLAVKLAKAYTAKSYQTQEPDNSVDMIFVMKSAHHFILQKKTLQEIFRVLKPGGIAFYFYEPTSPKYLYSLAYKRVSKKRNDVAEDILISKEILSMAQKIGLNASIQYFPSTLRRGPLEVIYYSLLKKIPLLQRFLPATANFIFRKP